MKELNEEIKLTLDLMQTDIDDGAHEVLHSHLYQLLEIKRDRLVTETGLQAELERERERRFEGLAMQAYIHTDPIMMHDDEDIAKMAYAATGAMIKER